jgi:hypothetical protein
VSERFWRSSFGILTVLSALGAGSAAAQDYTAGKTAAQLFQSDCSACHKSPGGLAKGRDARTLASFLREHYTTKEESAAALAAYVAGSGSGSALVDPKAKPIPGAGPKPKPEPRPATAESEPGQKPPKPRATAATEPKPGEEGDTSIMREEPSRRAARTPARDGIRSANSPADTTESKLNAYAAAGGEAREIERLADRAKKLESYANSGSAADAVTPAAPKDAAAPPAEPGAANAAAAPAESVNAARKRKDAAKKKDAADAPTGAGDTTAGTSAPHAPRPRRAQAPVIQPVPGNN